MEEVHVRGAVVTEENGPGLQAMQISVVTEGREWQMMELPKQRKVPFRSEPEKNMQYVFLMTLSKHRV